MRDLYNVIREIKPCDCDSPYIFISYSNSDRELVWNDVLEFQRRGYNVWLDEKNLDKTKDSWKEDALEAIEDMDCVLLVFYVSAASLSSAACYQELSTTVSENTKALHFGPVKFIAVDAEAVGDIKDFHQRVFENIKNSGLDKEERKRQALTLNGFMNQFFNSNNEKVRVHPKNEENRKMDYYEEILASFPDETKIYPEKPPVSEAEDIVEPAESEMRHGSEHNRDVNSDSADDKNNSEKHKEKTAFEDAEPQEPGEEQESGEQREQTDHFTYYKKRPEEVVCERKYFTKKDIQEAQQGNGLYRVNDGYTDINVHLFGSVFGSRRDMVRLELPDSMESLNIGEFKDCISLRGVRMPGYVEKISSDLFKGCISLKSMEIPGNVTVIESGAFQGCASLEKLKLPAGLKKLGMDAFANCIALQEVYLPKTLEKMGMDCFKGCARLSEIIIPGTLKKLAIDAFSNCYSLRKVVLENGVEEMDGSFKECGEGLHIWIPDSVRKIGGLTFENTCPVFHCSENSYAHNYAKKNGISYVIESREDDK